MSEAKFTKGEWGILPIEDDKECIRIRGTVLGGRYKIANVTDLKHHHDDSGWCKSERLESKANARLIIASPKMYEELCDLEKWLRYREGYEDWHKRVKSILEDVRGVDVESS